MVGIFSPDKDSQLSCISVRISRWDTKKKKEKTTWVRFIHNEDPSFAVIYLKSASLNYLFPKILFLAFFSVNPNLVIGN